MLSDILKKDFLVLARFHDEFNIVSFHKIIISTQFYALQLNSRLFRLIKGAFNFFHYAYNKFFVWSYDIFDQNHVNFRLLF